jgi:hypothetical protein
LDDRLIPLEGGLYAATCEKPLQILKVLNFEDEIVHIRLYKSRFDEIPARVDPPYAHPSTVDDADGFGMEASRLGTFRNSAGDGPIPATLAGPPRTDPRLRDVERNLQWPPLAVSSCQKAASKGPRAGGFARCYRTA